ncbi:MAG TPA: precorrin-2 C(20)-methyltransferase [Ruminiclostridium sp.]
MTGILYGVGVGPGDPKLLTLQAVEVLQRVSVIAVPDTDGEKTAMKIVKDYIKGKEIMYCPMPMSRDLEFVASKHQESCEMLERELIAGKDIAFITLGDPTIYSTYMYIHKMMIEKGYSTKIIPGITSFCAAAAALNTSLCDRGDVLHIIPASYPDAEKQLMLDGSKVLMKSGKKLGEVKETLKRLDLYKNSQMVECCSMENEKIYRNLDQVSDDSSYFSIIIVKDK